VRRHSTMGNTPEKPRRRKTEKPKRSYRAKAARNRRPPAASMEIARLTRKLNKAREEQIATSEVLKVISRPSVHLEKVLDLLVETVARLCRADHALMFRLHDNTYHLVAAQGLSQEAKEFFLVHPFAPGRGTLAGRVALDRRVIHLTDVLRDPEYTHRAPRVSGARTSLGIPLLRASIRSRPKKSSSPPPSPIRR
jgi:GAF domain-containing protein